MSATMKRAAVVAYLLAVLLIIYAPAVGRGFIADDFGWITKARPPIAGAMARAFTHTDDFYRPLVSFSFAVNYAASGLHARAYGFTNLALLTGCAFLVALVASLGGLGWAFALLSAALFAFNFHGIEMGVLWISGRTSLFLTFWALAAAAAFLKGKTNQCAVYSLLAMLSKEEAVVLPFVFALWDILRAGGHVRALGSTLRRTALIWAMLVVYAVLRTQAGALVPANAPPFYRFSTDPSLLVRNIVEYAHRAGMLSASVVVLVALIGRSLPRLDSHQRSVIAGALIWLCFGFALTIFLPVRSNLYAVFPSVGAAVIASTLVAAMWPGVGSRARVVLIVGGLLLPLVLLPVYRARAERWVSPAELSDAVVTQLAGVATQPGVRHIVLRDDTSSRLGNAIGPAASDIAALISDGTLTVELVPPETGYSDSGARDEIVLALDPATRRLVQVSP